ncbi:MogA/MoaB family molybdenum cofactor biosynthesis protein [Pallidibacillus thermolactis]|jgi:molybdenum cofactor biosynthesis protein B|uniref:MogA/MoaB family molybdenum cofactor biosynthesis protein n=1 Tax=Pallidibacillus thermolactis TaxID=251051 RepID=UPI00156BB7A7|nr:MogA/MoaB family molybdenum cofactor biosynthesis protein [Pallidibacillus thermolactis]MCU9600841.1 MogA/MoaB family molybdenum cofactor biosynthesis protein [Pallidibacillus thermolactis subsp. kokeshiiformis]
MAHYQSEKHPIGCAVITVSDTRVKDTDKSGRHIVETLQQHQHKVIKYEIISDEKTAIQSTLLKAVNDNNIEAVIFNGGTGISQRDVTIESIKPFFTKEMPGFGEIFRYLSYRDDIGSKSILSRAVSGVVNNRIVFAIPGSTGAVKLAMEKLILPELHHIVTEIYKDFNKR